MAPAPRRVEAPITPLPSRTVEGASRPGGGLALAVEPPEANSGTLAWSVRRAQRHAALLGAVLTLGLVSASASRATPATTAPASSVLVYFVITDKGISHEILRQVIGGGNSQLLLDRYVVRGDVAHVTIINRGHKPYSFIFYGHTIPTLKPGTRATFSATMMRRGSFPYSSPTDASKTFRGALVVS